jgi:hypothetical protein
MHVEAKRPCPDSGRWAPGQAAGARPRAASVLKGAFWTIATS